MPRSLWFHPAWGSHTSKAGVDIHLDRLLQLHNSVNFAGRYDFTVDTSNPLDSGDPYANAMLFPSNTRSSFPPT